MKEKSSTAEDSLTDSQQPHDTTEIVNGPGMAAASHSDKENGGSDEVGSDPEDITELKPRAELRQDIDHYKTTMVQSETMVGGKGDQSGASGQDKVPEREPIEDDNEWEYRHTALPTRPSLHTGIESVKLQDLQSMFNMEQRSLVEGDVRDWRLDDFLDYEEELLESREAAQARIQNEARELAAYKYVGR